VNLNPLDELRSPVDTKQKVPLKQMLIEKNIAACKNRIKYANNEKARLDA